MRAFLTRFVPRRGRFTVAALMVAVALAAAAFNALRPITRAEAIRIATARFRLTPGSERWANPRVRAFSADGRDDRVWIVDFDDPAGGGTVAQFALDRDGRTLDSVLGY